MTLTIRLSADDKAILDELVRKRSERLADEGVDVSVSSVIRALIRQAADTLDPSARKAKS